MTRSTPSHALPRHRFGRTTALTAGLALALSACSWGGQSGERSTTAGTAPSTATSTSAASVASASPSTGSDGSSASLSSSDSSSGTPSSSGAYIPASADSPAQNVPKPVMPEEMKENTEKGAEAAVKYWWETVYYLQQTNDDDPLLEISSPDCPLCQAYPGAIERVYKSGGWHVGSNPNIVNIMSTDIGKTMTVTALVDVEHEAQYSAPGVLIEGTAVTGVEKQPWTFELAFDPKEGFWTVTDADAEGMGQ